jgi:hypothetical protein
MRRAMPRPGKAAHIRRIELRLAEEERLLVELAQECRLRGVELTHHIRDLLRSRYLLPHGQTLTDLLWVPGSATAESATHTPEPDAHPVSDASATAAAAAWMNLLEMEGAF